MLDVIGEMSCNVVHKGKKVILPMIIANHVNKPTLLGRNWLQKVKLNWGEIFNVTKVNTQTYTDHNEKSKLDELLAKHKSMFDDSYEGMKVFEAHITIRGDAKPVFLPPRRVPYALKDQVEKELENLKSMVYLLKQRGLNGQAQLWSYRNLMGL